MQPQQQPSSVGTSKVATTPTGVGNHSNNDTDEPLSDRLTTPGTLSRSSTASLGVLNTLNEILAAAEDDLEEDAKVFDLVATMSHEAEPMDEPAELMGPASLATIDESLSPLPPLSMMSLEGAEEAKAEETKAALAVSAADDPDDISLNSVEFEEGESKAQKAAKIKEEEVEEEEEVVEVVSKPSAAAAAANTLTNQAPKMNSKMNPLSKMTVNTHSKLPGPSSAATRKSTFQGKFGGGGGGGGGGSSKGSSVNASRTTTPTLSESEFGGAGSLNSLGSAHSAASLHKAVTSKLGGKTTTTSAATPSSRLGLKRTLPVNTRLANQTFDSATFSQQKKNSIAARKHDLNTTGHPTALGRNTISRSSTYTRSLNTAPNAGKLGPKSAKVLSKALPATSSQLSTKGALKGSANNTITTTTTGTSFAKPTASSTLKKSTAASTTAPALKRASSPATSAAHHHHHQLTAPPPSKRPSSVASNCSSVASSNYSAAAVAAVPRLIQQQQKNATRTPLFRRGATKPSTPATGGGHSSAKSNPATPIAASSSRRSSATSGSTTASSKNGAFGGGSNSPGVSSPHTAHKQTTTEQLRQYQALYWQQTETMKRYRLEHCRSTVQSSALLAVTAHLINEYSPFETPSLRRELHSLNAKCWKLNRDYELSKEAASQKENTILQLEKRLWEQGQELDAARAEVAQAAERMSSLEQELAEGVTERGELEERVAGLRQELEAEREEHSSVLASLKALEDSCRSDRKYRDLKEKINTYQKEVDSLNVVLEMKTQRNRNLETEQMRMQMELANYESLKETYQNLRRENEALAETVSLKARKNAEHAREIDTLRASLKKEQNERKRMSIRNDQLQYKLDETVEMLHSMTVSEMMIVGEDGEEDSEKNGGENKPTVENVGGQHDLHNSSFVPMCHSSMNKKNNGGGNGGGPSNHQRSVRRLFSTPGSLVTGGALSGGAGGAGADSQRQHFQHQEPTHHHHPHHPHHHHSHRAALPELVLSSIGASSHWSSTTTTTSGSSGPSSASSNASSFSSSARNDSSNGHHNHNHHQHNHNHYSSANSSPLNSPKLGKSANSRIQIKTEKTASSPPSAQVPSSTTD